MASSSVMAIQAWWLAGLVRRTMNASDLGCASS
jgi:hypothetical protein